MVTNEELKTRFTYHDPQEGQQEKHEKLRQQGHYLALTIVDLAPESREQSLALTKLEEAVMWANAAIARRTEAITYIPGCTYPVPESPLNGKCGLPPDPATGRCSIHKGL